jgi:HEAT repeat protein
VEVVIAALLLQTSRTIERFRSRAADPDPETRTRAVDSLSKYRSRIAATLLAPLLADDHPRVRLHAVRSLSAFPRDEVVDVMCDRIRSQVRGRVEAVRVLGAVGGEPAARFLIELLSEPALRAEAAAALGRIGHLAAVEPLASMAAETSGDRIAQLGAMAALDPPRSRPLARERASDPDATVRMMCARLLADESGLRDRDWRVRLEAIEKMEELKRVEPLIGAVESETGRLRERARMALQRMTGREFGFDARSWRRWWAEAEETFQPGSHAAGTGPGALDYFGAPFHSNRLAMVVDLCDARARRETARFVDGLPAEVEFTLMAVGGEPWERRLLKATELNKALAIRYVNRQPDRADLDLYAALEAARESGADTICVWERGGRWRGVFADPRDVVELFGERNRLARVRVVAAGGELAARLATSE